MTGQFKIQAFEDYDSAAVTGTHELMLEEKAATAKIGGGYNPYDTFPNVREGGLEQRQADLRRLSEWIRLKRQVAQLKKSDD
ncbi:MAG TPA: hypothetical protein VMI92_14560 [Steroidobacteraceae bacterium]|nr:hypothetical protein [Steroidobacteraceae bacterium]